MDFQKSSFNIIKNHNCPLYQKTDEFTVVGRSLTTGGKAVCLTLMGDIIEALVKHQGRQSCNPEKSTDHMFNCSGYRTGCPGTIRLTYGKPLKTEKSAVPTMDKEISLISNELNNFSIFKTLNDQEFTEIISYFKIKDFKKGKILLRKGDRGENLFVILSGEVEIIGDYGIPITTLGRGEIFGEMSLLTGNPVSTKVKVIEDMKAMCMSGNYFRMILTRFAPLQMYFTRLLARRLAKSNIEKSKQFSSGMSGNLSEITTTELLQALNMTQKTGSLNLKFPKGPARIAVREGHIVHAEFMKMEGKTAFFEIVKQKRGNFKFEPGLPPNEMSAERIGDFMYLIMEAMNRIDEECYHPETPETDLK